MVRVRYIGMIPALQNRTALAQYEGDTVYIQLDREVIGFKHLRFGWHGFSLTSWVIDSKGEVY